MKTHTVTARGRPGFIFEGEFPQTYCFVPIECLDSEGDIIRLAEVEYVRTGWAERNMRFNDAGEGHHLFPNAQRMISDFENDPVRTFLHRLACVQVA